MHLRSRSSGKKKSKRLKRIRAENSQWLKILTWRKQQYLETRIDLSARLILARGLQDLVSESPKRPVTSMSESSTGKRLMASFTVAKARTAETTSEEKARKISSKVASYSTPSTHSTTES